jgi:hypothetical protein
LQRHKEITNWNPYSSQTDIIYAKVVAVHSNTGTVDVALDGANGQGGFYTNVPVLSWSYAAETGQTYLPSNIKLTTPMAAAQGTYDQPTSSGAQDVWCVIAHLSGRAQRPVCLGFISPLQSQIHTKDAGYDVKLHESGVYTVIDPTGNVTVGLSDGSSIVVGTTTTPVDMTTQNTAWNPKTTTTPYNVTMNLNGNVSITTKKNIALTVTGNITMTVQGNVTLATTGDVYLGGTGGAAVARVGDAVSVSTTTGIGTITSGSNKVFSG